MLYYVYTPADVPKRCQQQVAQKCPVLGYHMGNSYVIVDVLLSSYNLLSEGVDPQLRVIGHIYLCEPERSSLMEIDELHFRLDKFSQKLYLDETMHPHDEFSIVSYSPPNLRNLEYFTVKPILLQSTGKDLQDRSLIEKMDQSHRDQKERLQSELSTHSDAVMDKINQCQRVRGQLKAKKKKKHHQKLPSAPRRFWNFMVEAHYNVFIVTGPINCMRLAAYIIQGLNSEKYGFVPVKNSTWCRQLDLRLRQVNYLPVQFMCYYKTGMISEDLQKRLGIPPANRRLNISNSNYINLYNSAWLIFNDVLLGRVCYYLLVRERVFVFNLINKIVLKSLLFANLENLITWVGLHHPAGFKLNNDLGSFMESIFIWTSQAWTVCFDYFLNLIESNSLLCTAFAFWFRVSCSCGFSFLIASLIDYLKLINLHIYFFNIATTKIYNRQVEMLKSLVQLFRGKKYNVLRHRVDLIEESRFRIDQLLLGTFCFMVLLYLLPTTFAFYILFFLARITILTLLKLGDKVILSFNLYPLFVVLLKLKNSRRLQGGVQFQYCGRLAKSDWYIMVNKALTFDEIYGNFYKVFRQEGQYVRLFMNLLEGKEPELRDTTSMKKNYLMLPRNYKSTSRVYFEMQPNSNVIWPEETRE